MHTCRTACARIHCMCGGEGRRPRTGRRVHVVFVCAGEEAGVCTRAGRHVHNVYTLGPLGANTSRLAKKMQRELHSLKSHAIAHPGMHQSLLSWHGPGTSLHPQTELQGTVASPQHMVTMTMAPLSLLACMASTSIAPSSPPKPARGIAGF